MATAAALRRLTKEYMSIRASPPDYLNAKPLEHDILEWHYVLTGPPDTPYFGGEYHGKLVFPPEYPFRPPAIYMTTPNGRFQTDTRLCLSMSDFHPGHWNPSWSVATILNGLLSFMVGDESTTGSVHTSDADKRWLSTKSHAYNRSNPVFREVFPELCMPITTPIDALHASDEIRDENNTVIDTTTATATIGTTVHNNTSEIRIRGRNPGTSSNSVVNGVSVNRHQAQPVATGGTLLPSGVESWGKFILLVVVGVYLIAVKLAARAT